MNYNKFGLCYCVFSEVLENLIKLGDDFGPEPFKLWMGTSFGVVIIKPEDSQVIIIN
jgi:hypothetical protein